jgi:hypothetical protein
MTTIPANCYSWLDGPPDPDPYDDGPPPGPECRVCGAEGLTAAELATWDGMCDGCYEQEHCPHAGATLTQRWPGGEGVTICVECGKELDTSNRAR